MQVIIDRFEGDFAVVELPTGSFVDIPKELLTGAHSGDVIDININHDETAKRSAKIQQLMNSLFED